MNNIKISRLKIFIKNKEILFLNNLNLKSGDYLVLKGKNGEGKSTLLKCLSGDIVFEKNIRAEGSIKINGTEYLGNYNSETMRKKICYIPQKDNYFTEKTIFDEFYIAFKMRNCVNNKEEVIEFLKNNKIDEIAPEIFNNLNKNPMNLSGGGQRLLTIIIWLLSSQKSILYLIDEPFNNLDIYNVENVKRLIFSAIEKNPQSIFLIISHFSAFFDFVNGELIIENKNIFRK